MGMRISSGAAGASQMGGVNRWQQKRQDFNQLATALQSGDLSSAQKAFASISAKSPAAASSTGPMADISKALQAGDINAAMQAFSSMRTGHSYQPTQAMQASASSPSLASSGTVGTLLNMFA